MSAQGQTRHVEDPVVRSGMVSAIIAALGTAAAFCGLLLSDEGSYSCLNTTQKDCV